MPQHNHHNNPRHNNAPGRNDHEQSAPDEQEIRQHDAGAFVVDPLRDIYRFTDEPHRDKLMSSFDGVRDMNDLVGVARNGMDLSDGQQVFVSYMGAQARNVSLREHLNWTALEGGGDADNPSEEVIKNVSDVLAAVREKEAEARTKGDKAEADRLKDQVLNLIGYRQLLTADEVQEPGSKNADEVKVGEQYVKALKKAEYWKHKVVAPDEEKAVVFNEYEKAARALGERGDNFYTQAKAMEAILEHAGDKFAVEPDVADVQMDPRFEYKDTDRQVRNANRRRARLNAKQNPQSQQAPNNPPQTPRAANPRAPQNPPRAPRQPQTPNVPPQNPGNMPPPPRQVGNQPPQPPVGGNQPPQGPNPGNMPPRPPQGNQPPAGGGNQPPQGPQGPGNQPPAGGGQPPQGGNTLTPNNQRLLESTNAQIERIREALAFEKSKMFRNSRLGRAAMRLVGGNYLNRMDAMEDEYARLSELKFGFDNYAIRHMVGVGEAAAAIEAEQDKLREKTNEVMRGRVTAKFCKWLGSKKGIWATVGVGAGLAVLTPLGLAAGGIGLGLHMAAWHDRKTRGMRKAHERMPAEMARRFMVGRIAANPQNRVFFKEGMRYSMREFDRDISREMYKRLGSVGIGLATAFGANYATSYGLSYLQGGGHEPILDWMRANNDPWGV